MLPYLLSCCCEDIWLWAVWWEAGSHFLENKQTKSEKTKKSIRYHINQSINIEQKTLRCVTCVLIIYLSNSVAGWKAAKWQIKEFDMSACCSSKHAFPAGFVSFVIIIFKYNSLLEYFRWKVPKWRKGKHGKSKQVQLHTFVYHITTYHNYVLLTLLLEENLIKPQFLLYCRSNQVALISNSFLYLLLIIQTGWDLSQLWPQSRLSPGLSVSVCGPVRLTGGSGNCCLRCQHVVVRQLDWKGRTSGRDSEESHLSSILRRPNWGASV